MEILFWIWVVPAVFFTGIFLLIALFASLVNIQTGAVFGGLAIGIFGPPVAVILGALWPVTWPLFSLFGHIDEKRTEKERVAYEKRLSEKEGYGKLMKITEVYPHLKDRGYLGSVVKVIQLNCLRDGTESYVEFIDDTIRTGRFYWPNNMMEEV